MSANAEPKAAGYENASSSRPATRGPAPRDGRMADGPPQRRCHERCCDAIDAQQHDEQPDVAHERDGQHGHAADRVGVDTVPLAPDGVSTKRPAGASASVRATAAMAYAMPLHTGSRCSTSTRNTGMT